LAVIWQCNGFLDERGQRALKKVMAWNANDGNITKAKALDDAIVAEAAGKELASSIEFARKLRPGVRVRLELPPEEKCREGKGWPTASAIKNAISDRIKPNKIGQL
jgi:hypothetical protein